MSGRNCYITWIVLEADFLNVGHMIPTTSFKTQVLMGLAVMQVMNRWKERRCRKCTHFSLHQVHRCGNGLVGAEFCPILK